MVGQRFDSIFWIMHVYLREQRAGHLRVETMQLQGSIRVFIDPSGQSIVLLRHHIQKIVINIIAKSKAEQSHAVIHRILCILLDLVKPGLPNIRLPICQQDDHRHTPLWQLLFSCIVLQHFNCINHSIIDVGTSSVSDFPDKDLSLFNILFSGLVQGWFHSLD
uniref:Uncharacterized protein n=1 Tax=Anguilla anguilla TaxID=7936 RepID=A0A0E9XS27_ANGAN